MPSYNSDEYAEMVIMYGECGRNAKRAQQMYRERFPDRRPHPSNMCITRAVNRLRRTGSFQKGKREAPARHGVQDVDVIAHFELNPHTSTRDAALACGLSPATVLRILKKQKYHPYHLQVVQALHPNDPQMRLDWCNEMLIRIDQTPEFLQHILWTDEAKFTRDGIVNRHNQHFWASTNPHWIRQGHNQVQWSVNVWCGIHGDRIVGPIVYDGNLNGQRYLALLQTTVGEWAENLPLHTLAQTWFQQDGAPPHRTNVVSAFLNTTFGDQWMGQFGPVRWPARSPDLTPLDFYLWGHLKDLVYATPPQGPDDLRNRVTAACRLVTNAMLQDVRDNLYRRLQTCVATEGGHIEHIL
jgi:hypothetical protein